jgi:hypothetical protein
MNCDRRIDVDLSSSLFAYNRNFQSIVEFNAKESIVSLHRSHRASANFSTPFTALPREAMNESTCTVNANHLSATLFEIVSTINSLPSPKDTRQSSWSQIVRFPACV